MSFIERCILGFDELLRAVHPVWPLHAKHPSPAEVVPDIALTMLEQHQSQNMMRVNLAGEVAAQGLYRGQMLLARTADLQKHLQAASIEELDHYVWCLKRLQELGAKASVLNPFWYYAAFSIGILAALVSDKLSLGFIIETEEQVGQHLAQHLLHISQSDLQSRAIIAKMYEDELEHAFAAEQEGGISLPYLVKLMMHLSAQIMIKTATII